MGRSKKQKMITIYGDILQETDDAILVDCDAAEAAWLPKSQIEYLVGENGDLDVEISLPAWLAEDKGLYDGMSKAQNDDAASPEGDNSECPSESEEKPESDLSEAAEDADHPTDELLYTPRAGLYRLRTETVVATVPLSPDEKEACARRITDALSERAKYKDLAASASAKAREADKDACKAAEVFETGEEERSVICDVFAEYDTDQLVYVERAHPFREIRVVAMTSRDRQRQLPLEDQPDEVVDMAQDAVEEEVESHDDATESEEQGCSVCAHRDSDDDACQGCGEDLTNFMPLGTESAQEPDLAESKLPF